MGESREVVPAAVQVTPLPGNSEIQSARSRANGSWLDRRMIGKRQRQEGQKPENDWGEGKQIEEGETDDVARFES